MCWYRFPCKLMVVGGRETEHPDTQILEFSCSTANGAALLNAGAVS